MRPCLSIYLAIRSVSYSDIISTMQRLDADSMTEENEDTVAASEYDEATELQGI
jgi:hypothetical protein